MTFRQYFAEHWREHIPLAMGAIVVDWMISKKLFGKKE